MFPEPLPLDWKRLPRWLRDTRRVVDERSPPRRRPLAAVRIARLAVPRLREPVFVIGAPRSGTSFLGEALSHARVFSYQYEPPIVKAAARCVHEGRWSRRSARWFYRTVYVWLLARRLDLDLRLLEKTPHNAFVLDVLAEAFPDARFVHIVRDGRDAALSHRDRGWLSAARAGSRRRESGGYPLGPTPRFWVEPERRAEFAATTDLHRCAWAWRRHVEAAIRKGRPLGRERYLEVRYEMLAADPAREAARLCRFLELTKEDAARVTQALGRFRPDSIGRWRRELEEDERSLLRREAGPLLEALGYEEGELG